MTTNKVPLKYSLASKKKPAPKIKNVLAQPLPRYWPEITENDRMELRQKLNEVLDGENKSANSGITLGMSSCLRLLKRNEISCLLLSGEIKPKFITTQIIFSIINKSEMISVLIVPELKKLTEEVIKISSLTLAVAKDKDSSLVHWIRRKAETFPIPDRLLEYYGTSKNNKNISVHTQPGQSNKIESKPPLENIILENLYLRRSSSDCRAFIPSNAAQIKSETSNKWSDFISLSNKSNSPEPMEVDIKPVKTEKISLKELLQKATKLKKENKMQKSLNQQKEKSKIEISNRTTSENFVEPPKIKLKKKKKKNQNIPEDNSKQLFNYVSLKVNKIRGNPDKVKRKKKKNTK